MSNFKPFFKADLPLPPSVNHYWGKTVKRAKGGQYVHVYLTAKANKFRASVIAYVANLGRIQTHTGRIKAVITVHPRTNHKKTDIDNYAKGSLDALAHARVYNDDSQIDELVIIRGEVVKGGKLSVELWSIEQ